MDTLQGVKLGSSSRFGNKQPFALHKKWPPFPRCTLRDFPRLIYPQDQTQQIQRTVELKCLYLAAHLIEPNLTC